MHELTYGPNKENTFNNIYNSMRIRNINNIHNNKLKIDTQISVKDIRKCFGISTMLEK